MVVISLWVYFLNFDDESWACDWITQHHRYVPWHMNFLFADFLDYQWCSSCKSNYKESRSGCVCLSDVKASIKGPSSAVPSQHLKLSNTITSKHWIVFTFHLNLHINNRILLYHASLNYLCPVCGSRDCYSPWGSRSESDSALYATNSLLTDLLFLKNGLVWLIT